MRACVCVCAGVHPPHGAGVRVPVRAGPVQVAPLAAPAEGEAADHLGLQDPLPGRALPAGRRQVPVCGRRPGQRPTGHRGLMARRPFWF